VATHRIYLDRHDLRDGGVSPLGEGETIAVEGDEAKHAVRVKRLGEGDPVELLDGLGGVGSASVESTTKLGKGGWRLTLRVRGVRRVAPSKPELEVWSAPAKGERLERMIDQLSQAGAASWSPLDADRTVVHPREGKLGRLERVACESAKQCGRAWRLAIRPGGGLAEAMRVEPGERLVVADASGEGYRASGADRLRLLVGPEGGWTGGELDRLRHAGATVASFGEHMMRIETACVVAAGVVLAAECARAAASAADPTPQR